MLELRTARRDALLALIARQQQEILGLPRRVADQQAEIAHLTTTVAEQRVTIERLAARVRDLEVRSGPGGRGRMPGHKPDQAAAAHILYTDAVAFRHPSERERLRTRRCCEERLLAVCQPFLQDPSAPQRALCARIERHLSELFVFVAEPEVPPDNNAAERSLRCLVTCRKFSGGTRSPQGTATKMATASLFGTWALQGLEPLAQARQLLASPRF